MVSSNECYSENPYHKSWSENMEIVAKWVVSFSRHEYSFELPNSDYNCTASPPKRLLDKFHSTKLTNEVLKSKLAFAKERRKQNLQRKIDQIVKKLSPIKMDTEKHKDRKALKSCEDEKFCDGDGKILAFQVMEPPKMYFTAVPKRLFKHTKRSIVTHEDIQFKLQEAEERRLARQQYRLEKMKNCWEKCKNFDRALEDHMISNNCCKSSDSSNENANNQASLTQVGYLWDSLKKDISEIDDIQVTKNGNSSSSKIKTSHHNLRNSPRYLHQKHPLLTKEDIDKKMIKAEERRKAIIDARVESSRKANEMNLKIDAAFKCLLENEAFQKGLPGTEVLKPLDKHEIGDAYQTVLHGIKDIGTQFGKDIDNTKKKNLEKLNLMSIF